MSDTVRWTINDRKSGSVTRRDDGTCYARFTDNYVEEHDLRRALEEIERLKEKR